VLEGIVRKPISLPLGFLVEYAFCELWNRSPSMSILVLLVLIDKPQTWIEHGMTDYEERGRHSGSAERRKEGQSGGQGSLGKCLIGSRI